jgi:hypothetical protein
MTDTAARTATPARPAWHARWRMRRPVRWLAGPWGRRMLALLGLAAAGLSLAWMAAHAEPPPAAPTHLALVLPDGWPADDVQVQAWRDAAEETGFPLVLVRASQLLRRPAQYRDAALILPDAVHRRMNDALLAQLAQRVRGGAKLMLVHDAGVADMEGQYMPQSRLSDLAGVRYALFQELGTGMLGEQEAWVDAAALPLLQLPPGKLVRQAGGQPLTSLQPPPDRGEALAVAGYHYGRLRYPVFATRGRFDGQRLVHGEGGNLLAGVRAVGQGQVLFVNLPLTYLKLRTDGLFLHSFLRYFAQDLAGLAQLSPMPDARGALVLNWHIDAANALPAMQTLATLGAFSQGPYSVHITAGPDVDRPGDGQGTDLANNTALRQWVRQSAARGDEIGSHGGWIHNAFGRAAQTLDPAHTTELITRNSDFVRAASGRPVREYSAPLGNHPAWVTPWLHSQGVRAYYFTGDTGMPPTRSYQDGQRSVAGMWAFPVLSFGSVASFEEAWSQQVAEPELAAWLTDVSDYCANQRSVRLVYFHPPGIALFAQAFSRWMQHNRNLVDSGRLRWMTMSQYADFANRRLGVRWQIQPAPAGGGPRQLVAGHDSDLAQMSWLLPAAGLAMPRLLQGQAGIQREGAVWRITASSGRRLVVALDAAPATPAAATQTAAAAAAPLSHFRSP